MATEKPRITITLEPAQHEVLKRLSALQGGSMSKIVSEFLGEITPILEKVADSLESAKRASADARARFVRAAEVAEEELRPLADFAKSQFDLFAEELQRLGDQAQAGEGCDGVGAPAPRPAQHSPASEGSPQPVITGATESQRMPRKSRGVSKKAASAGASLGAK
jgi:hypothetical protein